MKIKSFLLALLIAGSVSVKANGQLASAEAMFIYNFLRHIEWPQGSTAEKFVIGVYGNTETFNQLVNYTANRKVGTQSIEVRRINSPQEASLCQLIYVPDHQANKISQLKSTVGNSPCLIVSGKEGSNSSGSNIEFVIQDSRLKFRIDENKAKAQNLLISRTLIDMAI